MTQQAKQEIVAQVAEFAKRSHSVVVAEYRGLTSPEMTSLRESARAKGVHLQIVRNTLARLAVAGTEYECLNDALKGPVILAFSQEGPSDAARIIRDFAKEHEAIVVKAIGLEGEALPGSQLSVIASLPTKEEALSKLLSVIQAPVSKLVQTMAAPHTKLVRTLAALRDSRT